MVDRFIQIFTGLERAHGFSNIAEPTKNGVKVKSQSFVKREPVTQQLWEDHLNGTQSLGIVPINDDNKCRWGCIDIDSYAGFDHKKLIEKIKTANLPLVTCRSKSGGAHVFLFVETEVQAKVLRDKLLSISALLGYGGSEIFPKQVELKSQDDTGNFLNLPYFNSNKTVRYAFNNNGEAATLDGFFELYERNKVKAEDVEDIKVTRPKSEYNDAPPCIELMSINKITEGGRNNAMFHFGVYAKKKWPAEWKTKMTIFNTTATAEPLTEGELDIIKKQHDKKEWGYKCNDAPMCSLCDKKLCRERKYGIGEEIIFPALTDLQKVALEKPYYYLNVDGERLHLENVKYLKQQSLFQEAVMEPLDFKPPTVKPKDWDMIINPLMKNKELIKPPEGMRTEDQLQNHLQEFCLNRQVSTDKDDLKNGGVWTNEGEHYFVFDRFYQNFLVRRRWDIGYQRTAQMLKEFCKCNDTRIGKERISVFYVKQFDKKIDKHNQKVLKKETPF